MEADSDDETLNERTGPILQKQRKKALAGKDVIASADSGSSLDPCFDEDTKHKSGSPQHARGRIDSAPTCS